MARPTNLTKLKLVRQYTGDKFSAARGYDARKPLSKARLRTIDRYFNLVNELTARPHKLYRPKRGEKREAFEFSGQKGFPRFQVAIVNIPVPGDPYRFYLDKTRPRGSRFVMENRRTHEKSWHVPANIFLYENPNLFDEDAPPDPEFFEYVLEQYAEQGPRHTYVIEAGEHHMWGASGNIPKVAANLADLFKQYGAGNFDAFDKSSHFIGNWFRGIQVYSNPEEFAVYAMRRAEEKARYLRERPGLDPFTKYRTLKSGDMGVFYRGKLIQIVKANRR